MKGLILLLLAAVLMSGQVIASNSSEEYERSKQKLNEYCKSHDCRNNTHFKLKKKDGSYFEFSSETTPPVVQADSVTIYPGEELFIEADINDDRLTNLKSVKTIQHPEKTIKLSFWQDPTFGDGTVMFLQAINPFDKHLRYRIDMMTIESHSLQYTSSCPVTPGKASVELWPHPIFQLILTKLQFVEGEEARICK